VPAAAVIPAPIAYIKVVAVKKLVVGFWGLCSRSGVNRALTAGSFCLETARSLFIEGRDGSRTLTLNKLECLKQAFALNTLAWNKHIGLWFYFVGFKDRSND
jgi:hypothetical protein